MTMNVLKTTVGHILEQLFPENMAFTIASFLVEDLEEKEEDYKALCATLYGKTMKIRRRNSIGIVRICGMTRSLFIATTSQ